MVAPLVMAGKMLLPWLAEQGLGLLKGAVEAKGTEVVENLIGVKLPTTKEAMTPEVARVLKEMEFRHEEKLQELAIRRQELNLEEQKVAAADTDSARQQNMAISTSADASWLSKNIVPILALIVILGGGGILALHDNVEVRIITGNLMMLVLGFYFGTSLGSVKANQALRDKVSK